MRPRIGLALGGGFARGLAHIGVLRVFEEEQIPVHAIAGVSAGAMAAAAFASGASSHEIERVAGCMKFSDVARWTISRHGLAGSERMTVFLRRLLKAYTFEEMRIPLAVVATGLESASPVVFRNRGDVIVPIRASCSYPGLFRPVRHDGHYLVDGAMTMDLPAQPLREMGCTHVVSVYLPMAESYRLGNMLGVVNRCFQIMQSRSEWEWRRHSDVVVEPNVRANSWDSFLDCQKMIEAGRQAALEALPAIKRLFGSSPKPERTSIKGMALNPELP
jgi:NTE family protein